MTQRIIIKLTEEQIEALKPLRDKLTNDRIRGLGPGMILSQVFSDHMEVNYAKHETAKLLAEAQCGSSGHIATSAYDKKPLKYNA